MGKALGSRLQLGVRDISDIEIYIYQYIHNIQASGGQSRIINIRLTTGHDVKPDFDKKTEIRKMSHRVISDD